ncbi:MAG: CrcB family protein [Candidatus Viridilinea halotolerans]|uniref:Fluoride-specific ion channel FluC n=1 Tax=Candidatus Viridilinea halotolerans TaxID=2491704 RepID=A0A426U0Z5_9CHLR|nr:MAG: CrcB family protein [Candidatus Viridilinea halotolerans]
MINDDLAIAAGAILGATARYTLSGIFTMPYGTLAVNILGCLLIGLFQTIFLARPHLPRAWQRFIAVGGLGGLTTFSTVSVELVQFAAAGNLSFATRYLALSLGGGIGAAIVGIALARLILGDRG